MIDITPQHLETIQRILAEHVPKCEVRAFGSRVKWTAKDYSDLDLAVVGSETLSRRQLRRLKEAFEESDVPIRVDVVDWQSLSDWFKEVIAAEYKVIQRAEPIKENGQFGQIRRSWKTGSKAIADFVDIVMGQSPPGNAVSGDIGIPLLNGPTEFGPHHPTPVQFTTDARKIANPGDLLFCVRGSTTGRMNWADQKYAIGRGIAAFRHRWADELQPFVRAVIEFQLPELLAQATGSTFPSVSASQLAAIPYPNFSEAAQHTIAHILGTLEGKIELNRQMNETLEAIARTIFKSWFVDFDPVRAKMEGRQPAGMDAETTTLFPSAFQDSPLGKIPEGWEVEQISNVVEIIKGRSYKSSELVESDTALVTLKSIMRGGGYRSDGLKPYTGKYKPEQIITPGELVVSYTDLTQEAEVIGKPAIVRGDEKYQTLVASLDLGIIRPLESTVSTWFLYLLFRSSDFHSHIYGYATGTTVLHLSKDGIPSYQFALPTEAIRRFFDSIVRPLFSKIESNESQSRTLSQIRDALLPKLLSGELRAKPMDTIVT